MARQALLGMFDEREEVTRKLRVMWALHVIGGLEDKWLVRQLDNENEHIRSWAVRFLCEKKKPSGEAVKKFALLATSDKSSLVRLYLASALQRMPIGQRWDIAAGLVTHEEDNIDQNLPLMIWYGIEPAVGDDRTRALELVSKCRIPKLRRFIARRIASKSP